MVILVMRRDTQYNFYFHYLVLNFVHIYLERIVNTLSHLQSYHQIASLSIYGSYLLFSLFNYFFI